MIITISKHRKTVRNLKNELEKESKIKDIYRRSENRVFELYELVSTKNDNMQSENDALRKQNAELIQKVEFLEEELSLSESLEIIK